MPEICGTARRLYGLLLVLALTPLTRPLTAADEKTLQVAEADLRGAAVQKVEPEYPAVARQIRLTGDVDLEICVDTTGAVEKVTVIRGHTLLTGSSTQAIRKWKFNPFRLDGQPARVVGPIRFSFQM